MARFRVLSVGFAPTARGCAAVDAVRSPRRDVGVRVEVPRAARRGADARGARGADEAAATGGSGSGGGYSGGCGATGATGG